MPSLLKYSAIAILLVVVAYFAKVEYDTNYKDFDLECIERFPQSVGSTSRPKDSLIFCEDENGKTVGFFDNERYLK